MQTEDADLVVVGAGPAGLSGAVAAARHGARVVVIDEQPVPGGRLPCQVHEDGPGWWNGREVAHALVQEARAAGVRIRSATVAWGLQPGWEVAVQTGADPVQVLRAPAVLLATGAQQVPLALPGWTLPAVITAAAVQVLVNQYGVQPGRRAAVVGTDLLALRAARSLKWAGVDLLGVFMPPPGGLSGIAGGGAPDLRRQVAAPDQSVPVLEADLYPRRAVVAIRGTERAEGVVVTDLSPEGAVIPGSERELPVDLVCLGGGLSPLAELAAQAGCQLRYAEALGGWVPLHGPRGETELAGLFVAGGMTGVEGARVALAQGRLTGLTIAQWLGKVPAPEADAARTELARAIQAARAAAGAPPDLIRERDWLAAEWARRQPAG